MTILLSNDHVSRYHTIPLYEFCYGKHVVQYHVDRTGEKTTLLLGKFDEAAHLEWIKENKGKAPKSVGVMYVCKHVVQYHVDRTGEKTTLLLGKFDEAAHLEWIKENKGKAPKSVESRTSISHFYSGGDICDKTNKPRQTEVKLKCLENSSSPAQVSLYLLEPRTCHYILGVESPLICEILPLADENGLIKSGRPLLVRQDAVEDVKVEDEADSATSKEVPKFGND
ncbi:glucosidase II beta subunit-like protein domain-containing protein [Phthorimaea operculella]|nr:glucosidase II beta subunit-like protein domain-containing protein [Phthorimaea operculella]